MQVRCVHHQAHGDDGIQVTFTPVGGDPNVGLVVNTLTLIASGEAVTALKAYEIHRVYELSLRPA